VIGIKILQWAVFLLGTIGLIYVSRKSLPDPRSHGFYRFFSWETLLIMFLLNAEGWFRNPLAWHQLISWVLLVLSLVFVVEGVRLLREIGRQDASRSDPALLGMEKTSQLVTIGLYRYIRHPLYSSLFFLGWGMFFKSPSWLDVGLVSLCTVFLTATARVEERENIQFFGDEYAAYMKHTKMFIPFFF
jgi:protein-S-isoprenylcysteine O-methyltransferase Ste14